MVDDPQTYDVVIIGAGIGGLVCGGYLAKAGMKVLIVEQHYKPGGFCTSFKRGNFTFDAAAHSFGSYRTGGIIRMVLEDLGLGGRLRIKKYDPSDTIVIPGHRFAFWTDQARTIDEMEQVFPHELRIKDFFHFMNHPQPSEVAALRKKTYKQLLDAYLRDEELKAMIALPLFGYGGLPPSLMSAFTGMKIFSEFLLDGGYYPEGGMQTLPDLLAERFKEFGGTLLLSCGVRKIVVHNRITSGVILGNGEFIPANITVSNCDARQTLLNLLGEENLDHDLLAKLRTMKPSLSMFVLYLGVDDQCQTLPEPGTNEWFLPYYDLNKAYLAAAKGDIEGVGGYMVRLSPDRKTVLAFVNASFRNKAFWNKHKLSLSKNLLDRIERNSIRNLSQCVRYQDAASPYTLYRYTLNYRGASYGWESRPSQFADPDFRKPSCIQGLYLAGHWTTFAQGLPGVAYLGYDTAKKILKKTGPNWKKAI